MLHIEGRANATHLLFTVSRCALLIADVATAAHGTELSPREAVLWPPSPAQAVNKIILAASSHVTTKGHESSCMLPTIDLLS